MPKKYNIAIDVSPLSDGNSNRGVGYYTSQLIKALQSEVRINPLYKNFTIHLLNNAKSKNKNFDLVHYPYFDPFFLTLPSKKNIPQIITIHDLIPLEFKSHFPVGIRGTLKWIIQKFLARQSDYIITVSHYSRQVISQILKYPIDKIYVTYEAGDSSYRPAFTDSEKQRVIKKYNLPPKFILNNGDINWNKNIPTLVTACQELDIPLVLVGNASTKSVETHPWNSDIILVQSVTWSGLYRLGYVPDEDLPIIYSLATIYCQPSYAEGFGLSLVKAMQSGTPVVYSQSTSLPEVMADCGLGFDPYDPQSLNRALQKIWSDSLLSHRLVKAGLIRAKSFSWRFTAIQTLAIYDLALAK